jgi:putative transposase
MAKTEHYYIRFEEGRFYHIYNRTIDKQPLFKNEGNYEFFLKRYDEYLSAVVDTYAYCLLGNHFHLLIKVREHLDLTTFKKLSNLSTSDSTIKSVHDIVSHQFRKFFQSYAMAFNKQQERVGTLFQTPFKRALVDNDAYFSQLVYYIHANPQRHDLTEDFRVWKWSSYGRMLSDKNSKLKKQEVLEWFGGKEIYKQYHADYQKMLTNENLLLDAD